MEFRKITLAELPQLEELIETIENGLPHKEWWIPIDDTERAHFFDDEWTYFLGAFDGDNLAGACGLFYNEHEFGEEAALIGVDIHSTKAAEIGRCMVNPNYRGNNLMYELNSRLKKIALENGVEKILAVAHPDNIASNSSFLKLGAQFQKKATVFGGFDRNIYLI